MVELENLSEGDVKKSYFTYEPLRYISSSWLQKTDILDKILHI